MAVDFLGWQTNDHEVINTDPCRLVVHSTRYGRWPGVPEILTRHVGLIFNLPTLGQMKNRRSILMDLEAWNDLRESHWVRDEVLGELERISWGNSYQSYKFVDLSNYDINRTSFLY